MQTFLIDSFDGDITELARIGDVTFENFFQHLARTLVHFRYPRMIVNIRVKKFSERGIRLTEFCTVTNKRRRMLANVVSSLCFRFGN